MNNTEFEEVYDENFDSAIKFVRSYLSIDYDTAEEIVQDVFAHLYTVKDKIRAKDKESVHSYVIRAVRNKAVDYKRKQKRRNGLIIDDEDLDVENISGKTEDIEAEMLGMERKDYLNLIFERLRLKNPVNYDIFVNVVIMKNSPESVAEKYEITVNNVNNRIYRTRLWLKEELNKLYQD